MNNLFVFSGPSGVGKTTLARELVRSMDNLELSISCTTRPKRLHESEGKDYIFMTSEEFHYRLKNNEFIDHSAVSGHSYGTLRAPLMEILERGKDALMILDVPGAVHISHLFLKAILIFMLPPSAHVLKERLLLRGESYEWIYEHLKEFSLERLSDFHYLVINETLIESRQIVENIITARRHSQDNQSCRYPQVFAEWANDNK
jgi:guanylate kinase